MFDICFFQGTTKELHIQQTSQYLWCAHN